MAKFKRSNSKARIGLSLLFVVLIAGGLFALGIYALPTLGGEVGEEAPSISGIEYSNLSISKDADLSQVLVTIRYSDGTSKQIALSELLVQNLDVTQTGSQNVVLNYGGYEQMIPFNVVDTNCVITYKATPGGYINGQATQTIPAGQDGSTVTAVAEVGYEFVEWNDRKRENIRKETQVSQSMEFIANFRRVQHLVVFHYYNGTISREELVNHGDRPSRIPNPESNLMKVYGHRFIGWDQSYASITAPLEIYPIYEKIATDIDLTITQDLRNNTPLGKSDLRYEGYYEWGTYANIVVEPNEQRLFTGWSIRTHSGWYELGRVAQQNIQVYLNGNYIQFTSTLVSSATREYRLQFMPEEGMNVLEIRANFAYQQSLISYINYSNPYGTPFILPYDEPIGNHRILEPTSSAGDVFLGWYDNSVAWVNGAPAYYIDQNTKFTQDAVLRAHYRPKILTVTYNGMLADNKSELDKTFEVPYQGRIPDYEIPSVVPEREFYNFVGWYLYENGLLTSFVVDGEFTVFGNIEVRPRFEVITYKLDIGTSGAGAAYNNVNGNLQLLPTGSVTVNAITDYTLTFQAAEGYSVYAFSSTYGGTIQQIGDPVTRIDYAFKPTENMSIAIEYGVSYYNLVIHNGNATYGGSVTYQNDQGDGIIVNNDNEINLIYAHGTTKTFFFEAEPSTYIKSIILNGISIENVPRNALTYSLPIEAIDEHNEIIVNYDLLTYVVALPFNTVNYSVVPQDEQDSYPLGSSPLFDVSSAQGFYISAIRINGTAVNLYNSTANFTITNLKVNNETVVGSQDVRVTSFTIRINNLTEDKALTIEHAPLFYNVNVSRIGLGSLIMDNISMIGYNQNFSIVANTSTGYFVRSVVVNGVEKSYPERETQQIENFTNIKQDMTIIFNFNIVSHKVFFNGAGSNPYANATVYKFGEAPKPFVADYTENAGSNLSYIIVPNEGYYIHSLVVDGQDFAVDPTSNTQLVEINDINKNILVVADIRKILYEIEININNTNYGSVITQSGDFIVEYDGQETITFIPNAGYRISSVIYNSVNVTNNLIDNKLALNNVKGVSQISVVFERIIFNINIANNANGNIVLSNTSVSLGNDLAVSVTAHSGYVITGYLINDISYTVDNLAYISFNVTNITQTQNISVYYALGEEVTSKLINVNVTGNGSIYGNIIQDNGLGSYTIATGDDLYLALYAHTGNFIESVNGAAFGNIRSLAYYVENVLNGETINIVFSSTLYDIIINAEINGNVNSSISEGYHGDTVEYTLVPEEGYVLEYLKINGFVVATSGLSYTTTLTATHEVEAKFTLKTYNIINNAASNGSLTTLRPYYYHGDTVVITVIPNVGFYLSSLIIGTGEGSVALTQSQLDTINAASRLDKKFVVPSELATTLGITENGLVLSATFTGNQYNINIVIANSGSGSVPNRPQLTSLTATHGQAFPIIMQAAPNNFIDQVYVNGQPIDLMSLITNATINPATNELIYGTYTIDVRQDNFIEIVFKEDEFKVSVVDSFNGRTTVGDNQSEVIVNTGENVRLTMRANEGYHIASVLINGVFVHNSQLFPSDNPNHNSSNFYYILDVHENMSIRVIYEINTYTAAINTKNMSPNFKEIDAISNQYGIVDIYGYPSMDHPSGNETTLFYNIPHGSNLSIMINPIRSKGYYISSFKITWKPNESFPGFQEIIPLDINPNGYVYIFENITNDILEIEIIFERELFNLSEVVTSEVGTISTQFSNPITGNIVHISSYVNGDVRTYTDIEYGIQFITNVTAPYGYSRETFTVNNFSRLSYIRNNRYTSFVQSHMDIEIYYAINYYNVSIEDITYSFANLRGTVEIYHEGILIDNNLTVMHGTELTFVVIPYYLTKGYQIHQFNDSGNLIDIFNRNARFEYVKSIESNTNISVAFSINTYSIIVNQPNQGGRVTSNGVSTNFPNIEWGKNFTLHFEINQGYKINQLWINGIAQPFDDIVNGSTFVVSNVKEIQNISIVYVRESYTIAFEGNFDDTNTHMDGNVRVDPFAVFNGNIVDVALFSDTVYLHFKPAVGYELGEWSIYVNGVLQLIDYAMLTSDPNNRDWKIYCVQSLTGNMVVNATYQIKTYNVSANLNNNIIGSFTLTKDGLPVLDNKVEHFNVVTIVLNADYGYSLQYLIINYQYYFVGDLLGYCDVTYSNNNNTYTYAITLVVVDALIKNIFGNLVIEMALMQNFYRIVVSPVDAEGNVSNKMMPTGTLDNFHGDQIFIPQSLSEGYSITGLKINGLDPLVNNNYGLDVYSAINYNASSLSLQLIDGLVKYLDMHGTSFGSNDTLVFEYLVTIDMHTISIMQHTIETGVNPELQNDVAGITTTNLIHDNDSSKNETFITSVKTLGTSEYFTRASITSTFYGGLQYRFDGYQELIEGVWTKVENGQNGITITGNNITYIIKSDRVFRAVYYRQYNIIIDVVPEHKYVSGSYSLGNNTLNIREYGSILAEINVVGAPNVPLQDINPNNKFRYEYIVDCTSTMILSFNDSVAQNYSSEVKYQVVTYNGDIRQFSAPLHRPGIDGVQIVGDMYIYASFNNNIQFNIVRETIGSEHPSGTGNVPTYFLKPNGNTAFNQYPINLAQNPVKALDTVKIIVPTVTNYRFDGIYRLRVDTQSTLNQGRVIFYPNNWAKVNSTADGHVTITTEGTNTIYEIRVTDNSVYKITYYKTFDVTFSVDYKEINGSVQPTVTNALNSLAETDSHMYNPQLNRYDYGASFISVLNKDMTTPMLETLYSNYQFIGWYIKYANQDRFNKYRHIYDYYEDQYDLNVTLEQYNAFINPEGLQLDGIIKIEFIAVFVPVYEVTILNEYIYTSQEGTTFHFDGGDVTLTSQLYNGTFYNDSDTTVLCSNGFDNRETRYIMGSRMDPDNYDVWIDNYIYLDVVLNLTFDFVEWQIYDFELKQWVTFNYFGNEQTPTSTNYAPLLNRNMYIRPVYQKTVTINLNTIVFYYNHGSPTNDEVFKGEQNPLAEQITSGQIKSGKTITVNFDSVLTLFHGAGENLIDPNDNVGYEFLGWFREGVNYNENIPCYSGLGASTTIRANEWFIDQDSFGNPYNKSLDEYEIEARYIKLWQITVKSYNELGGLLGNNAPRITFDGEETYRAGMLNSVTRIMRAGTTLPLSVDYNNQTNYSNFSVTNDKFQRVVNSVHDDFFVYDNPSHPNYLQGYLYSQGNRTWEIVYRTYATLTITGILEGGIIFFGGHTGNSWNLHQAIGSTIVTDGDTDYDHSGIPGQIKMINLDVYNKNNGTSAYRGTYGTVLSGMNADLSQSLYTTPNLVIDFAEGNIPQKNLTLSYEFISGGSRPFESGQGTEDSPYKITSQAHLLNLGRYNDLISLYGIYFELGNSISVSNWINPLSNTGNGFDGNLNGRDHTISNLGFTQSGNYHGLFSKINNGIIQNLTISGTTLNGGGNSYIGYLAGYINTSTITNVTLSGGTVSGGAYVGGFAGEANNTVFSNCTISGIRVGSSGNFIGGFAGLLGGNSSRITNSKMLNSIVESSGSEVGGFVGRLNNLAQVNNNTLEGANTIGLNNSFNVGGFVGRINNTGAVFSNNEIKGNVTIVGLYHSHAAWYNYGAGGMVGRNQGIVIGNKITSGTVTMRASVGGGIVGVNYGTMGELNAAGNASVAASDNVLSGGLIDFDLRPQRSILGGHVGGNYGGTITGSRNTKSGSNNWTISNSMVVFRQTNITFGDDTANATKHGTSHEWHHSYFGGIAGYNSSGSTIRFSSNASKLLHARKVGDFIPECALIVGGTARVHMFMGGIVGENAGNILNCQSNGAIIKSFNFLDADQGNGSSANWFGGADGGQRRREFNRLGGIAGKQIGGTVNNNTITNTTIELFGVKYSDYRSGWPHGYNVSELRVTGRTGVGHATLGTRSGNTVGSGNAVSASNIKVGAFTNGTFTFSNDTNTGFDFTGTE